MEIQFGGLFNSLARCKTPVGRAFRMWNATTERAILESRAGIEERWRRSGSRSLDVLHGVGYGVWGDVEEYLVLIQFDGDPRCSVLVVNARDDSTITVPASWLNSRHASPWRIVQYDDYLVAINEVEGMWRKQIGHLKWHSVALRYLTGNRESGGAPGLRPQPTLRAYVGTDATQDDPTDRAAAASISVLNQQITVPLSGFSEASAVAGFATVTLEFASGLDLRNHRYLVVPFTVELRPAEPRPHENAWFTQTNSAATCSAWTTDSAAATVNNWGAWESCDARIIARGGRTTDAGEVWVRIDGTRLSAVRKLAIRFPIQCGNPVSFFVHPIGLGGVWLAQPSLAQPMPVSRNESDWWIDPVEVYGVNAVRPVEYVVQYFHTGTLEEGGAIRYVLEASQTFGERAGTGLPPIGCAAELRLAVGPANFNAIRIWRRRWSDSEQWILIGQVANAVATLVDTRIEGEEDWLNARFSPAWWNIAIPSPAIKRPGNFDWQYGLAPGGMIRAREIAAWKTHMVLGARDGLVYLSQANEAQTYAPPPGVFTLRNYDDETGPRTLYVAQDRSDSVQRLIAGDVLYAIGSRGVYAMIGDTARGATPFRLLPNSRGITHPQSAAAYMGGVLVAASDGLYWYRVNRASVVDAETVYDVKELTEEVRLSYGFLVRQALEAPIVVCVHENEIWIIRGRSYLKYTKTDRWEEGSYNEEALRTGTNPNGSGNPYWPEVGAPDFTEDDGYVGIGAPRYPEPDTFPDPPYTGETCAESNWSITVTGTGTQVGRIVHNGIGTDTNSVWDWPTVNFIQQVITWPGSTGTLSATTSGQVMVEARWIGAGAAPAWCPLEITTDAQGHAQGTGVTYTGHSGSNGQGFLGPWVPQTPTGPLWVAGRFDSMRTRTHIVRVRGGVARKALNLAASLQASFVHASVNPVITVNVSCGAVIGQCPPETVIIQ